MKVGEFIELEGWLVIIDYKLFVIPEDYSDDYESGEKIEVVNSEIMFSVTDKILPLAGGGSFIFHRAKISAYLVEIFPIKVKLVKLLVEERGGDFVDIDVEGCDVERCKARYEKFLEGRRVSDSGDWLDYL
ncbi:hypothetical protein [Pseudomonas huaxiensis]|uniref:hypothetical protein n=1 Tax=Pseudomonas huaxiensis TaxID=2213017 RepID=UPI001CDC7CF1|nr:hypothetical protein [Pseudomonas huaxiensis]